MVQRKLVKLFSVSNNSLSISKFSNLLVGLMGKVLKVLQKSGKQLKGAKLLVFESVLLFGKLKVF